jgi:hypothetical protein
MFKAALSSKPEMPGSVTVFVGVTRRAYYEDMMAVEHLMVADPVFDVRGGGEVVTKLLPTRQARPTRRQPKDETDVCHLQCLTTTRKRISQPRRPQLPMNVLAV